MNLVVLFVDVLLVLTFELEEFLLCLIDFLLLDALGLDPGLFEDFLLFTFQDNLPDGYIRHKSYYCAGYSR